ncbi:hypothetical protein [Legionella waltersii]|uniref:Transmembrane protein n=1 Tax=Legionella waltersii TaxID=66969 RepID=A0A0W1A122_9GAMM|nr:hypothetical protein [Legionella waltersii]KTD75016.1 hypothetical protein Lwal_3057 [Legionella waltersii]SNV05539.1 Uncharacterised protein [Legionella waltersii]
MTKSSYDLRYLTLGAFASLIIIYGHMQITPQKYYVTGSILLLYVAIHYKLYYFIALELILGAGHSAILLNIGPYTQFALPLLLCTQLLVVYLLIGKENNFFLFIGILGIALLSIGFAYNNQPISLLGSCGIAIYGYYSAFNDQPAAFIWAILNTIVALFSLYNIIFLGGI